MKVALVHDYLREWGGAEAVVKAMHEIWPEAPLFTSYVSKAFLFDTFTNVKTTRALEKDLNTPVAIPTIAIQTSWLNYLPNFIKTSRLLTPLLPFVFSQFNFKNFDVVLSSSASFAKTVIVKKPTLHICYCHTTPRFLYGLQREQKNGKLLGLLEKPFDWWLRSKDQAAAKRVDYFIAPSNVVKERIKKIYNRDSDVIYPPVDVDKFSCVQAGHGSLRDSGSPLRQGFDGAGGSGMTTGEYFVIIGRLSPIKHFELAVEACTKLGLPLKVIGTGIEEAHLRSLADPTVEFLGRLSNQEAAAVIAGSKAIINTVFDEDFGMVPLEVLGAGKPVIAFASDAAKETMVEGVTGQFFHEPTVESLIRVLEHFDPTKYDAATLKEHAAQFSKEHFEQEIKALVKHVYNGEVKSLDYCSSERDGPKGVRLQ